MILLFGAPPPHPGDVSLQEFGNFVHDLACWTDDCRKQYMKWEGIKDPHWGEECNRETRLAFDNGFINWAYTLKPEEY